MAVQAAGALAAKLERTIVKRKIDIVMLDPFIKSHGLAENDNNGIDAVAQILTDLCIKYDIAVDVPHHMAKGAADPGNANRGRGASALKDALRLVRTATVMTPEEAKALGWAKSSAARLIRLDDAKLNIAPMNEAKWFRLVGIDIDNATELYPSGDNVQTVEVWNPPEPVRRHQRRPSIKFSMTSRPVCRTATATATRQKPMSVRHGG